MTDSPPEPGDISLKICAQILMKVKVAHNVYGQQPGINLWHVEVN